MAILTLKAPFETVEQIMLMTDEELMEKPEAKRFRALAARANYLAQDRMDLQYMAKEVCRDMCKPSLEAFNRLKKVARYLLSRGAVRFKFVWQEEGEKLI